ncbi:MAG: putative toxin-antitoxin system toxin component, PIN family, partial [Bacteroidetes bacterium]|nr:putative toxin-antitoxin system toxin component, PIN family [Bacteroidota bacterium]
MPKKRNRIVIDTNIWISFLLTKDFSAFDKIVSAPNIKLIFSKALIEEFIEVAQRSKFRKYFPPSEL